MKTIECTFADGTRYSFAPDDYPHWGPANQSAIAVVGKPLGGRQETLHQLTGDQWLLVTETLASVPTIRVAKEMFVIKKRRGTAQKTTHGKWLTDEGAMIWLLESEGGCPPRALPVALAELPNTLRTLASSKHLSPAAAEVVAHVKAVAAARQYIKSRMRADAKSDAPKKTRKRPAPSQHVIVCERLYRSEKKKDPSATLKEAVEMYVAKHDGEITESYLYRQVTDYRRARKTDT